MVQPWTPTTAACGSFIKSQLIIPVWEEWFSLTAYLRGHFFFFNFHRINFSDMVNIANWTRIIGHPLSPEYWIFLDFDLTDGVLIQAQWKQREIILYLEPLCRIQAVPADRKHSHLKVKQAAYVHYVFYHRYFFNDVPSGQWTQDSH